MTTQTPYYDLTLYNDTSDNVALYATYRAAQAGVTNSNMIKVDDALASLQAQIFTSASGSIYINALTGGSDAYAVTGISSITAYLAGIVIALRVDVANTGTSSLNINSLGVRTLYKVNNLGVNTVLVANDLIPNRTYQFIYDGFAWILLEFVSPYYITDMVNSATAKTTPVDADLFMLVDSAAGNLMKKLSWANIKTMLNALYMIYVAPSTAGNVLQSTGTVWASVTPSFDSRTVGTTTSSATPSINTDLYWMYNLTAQAVDITSFTTNLTGTPTDGRKLWISITGTGTINITWGASFESSTAALPTATVGTARLDVAFVWNPITSKFRCLGVA